MPYLLIMHLEVCFPPSLRELYKMAILSMKAFPRELANLLTY